MNDTEPNWDTGEVHLWLSNSEPLYNVARTCTSVSEMRRRLHHRVPGAKVIWSNVDWDYIFNQFEEDRNAD